MWSLEQSILFKKSPHFHFINNNYLNYFIFYYKIMKINPDEIKSHIKEHYGKSVGWREGFKQRYGVFEVLIIFNYL